MLRNDFCGIGETAGDPFRQLSVERGQLIGQVLHQTPVLEIGGDHLCREGVEDLTNEFEGIAQAADDWHQRRFAEIPKIMEEARREAEALKEDLRSQANKEIQTERQRLRRCRSECFGAWDSASGYCFST